MLKQTAVTNQFPHHFPASIQQQMLKTFCPKSYYI